MVAVNTQNNITVNGVNHHVRSISSFVFRNIGIWFQILHGLVWLSNMSGQVFQKRIYVSTLQMHWNVFKSNWKREKNTMLEHVCFVISLICRVEKFHFQCAMRNSFAVNLFIRQVWNWLIGFRVGGEGNLILKLKVCSVAIITIILFICLNRSAFEFQWSANNFCATNIYGTNCWYLLFANAHLSSNKHRLCAPDWSRNFRFKIMCGCNIQWKWANVERCTASRQQMVYPQLFLWHVSFSCAGEQVF